MTIEPQFLAFKGLKQYTPEDGWGQVNAILKSHTQAAQPTPEPAPAPDNVPTLTETPGNSQSTSTIFDPLINELFEQLRVPPSDELTHTWRTIAAEVNLLTERMALQRELKERLSKLEHELNDLRGTILSHLTDVQQAADQQLTSARLRAEVSALAQNKLAAKLHSTP
jgi:hypothetical protein